MVVPAVVSLESPGSKELSNFLLKLPSEMKEGTKKVRPLQAIAFSKGCVWCFPKLGLPVKGSSV